MPTNSSKALIIAGTHQREIDFSHAVADRILAHYGALESNPDKSFIGADNARKALLWHFGNISVAKIYKVGEPSSGYLKSQPVERLAYLARFKLQNLGNGAEYAETFEHESQWTSVHDPLINELSPVLLLDLHSYHKQSKGIPGTGGYITSYGNLAADELIKKALSDAKRENPEVYGCETGKGPFDSRAEIWRRIVTSLGQEKLLSVLQTEDKDRLLELRNELWDLEKKIENEVILKWGDNWYYNKSNKQERVSYFCFEAVHWGQQQQDATSKFVVSYLEPLLRKTC